MPETWSSSGRPVVLSAERIPAESASKASAMLSSTVSQCDASIASAPS
jgi:hypothetical protein